MEEGTRKENIDTDEYKIEKVDSSPTKKETKKSEPLLMRRRKNIPLSKVDGACSFSPPSTSQNIQLSPGNSFQMGKYNFFLNCSGWSINIYIYIYILLNLYLYCKVNIFVKFFY